MTCDRCEESRAGGSKYCPFCGADLTDCPMCQSQRDNGSRFCTFCGKEFRENGAPYPGEAAIRKDSVPLIKKVTSIMMPTITILLIVAAGCMIWGFGDVWAYCETGKLNVYAMVPMLIVVTTISGTTLQIVWVIIVLAILASLALLAKQSLPSLTDKSKDAVERVIDTPLYSVGLILGAILAMDLIILGIQAAFGYSVKAPEGMDTGRTAEALLDFANAGFWEEIISRFVPIGIPITIAALILGRKDAPKMLLGGFGMSKLAIVLIVISALMFGFAHSSGWGYEKVPSTFASGILFGYIYVKIGLHASIAVHFMNDYISVVMDTFLMPLTSILVLVVFCIGFVCLLQLILGLRGSKDKVLALPNWVPAPQDNMLFRREKD